ncbi:hypothetical protein Tco_1122415 [Tanacetum coccineum]|uniref:Uncharacterized protein n=1 Tax=Tanacetum coccineum TaxID=301880 RepID=A0ABQ5J0J6_9ASTR
MLCKQSHWFSYAKRCASAPLCIDDNRYSDSVITAPKPLAGSYNQLDVWRLSAFVVKLRDMPEGRLPFYCTHPTAADVVILAPTLEDLAATTLSTKVLAKAEV